MLYMLYRKRPWGQEQRSRLELEQRVDPEHWCGTNNIDKITDLLVASLLHLSALCIKRVVRRTIWILRMRIWTWQPKLVARMLDEEKGQVAVKVYSENKLREYIQLFTVDTCHCRYKCPCLNPSPSISVMADINILLFIYLGHGRYTCPCLNRLWSHLAHGMHKYPCLNSYLSI